VNDAKPKPNEKPMPPQAALFLDRDGVINHDPGDYICRPEDWHLLDGITGVMKAAANQGYRMIIITNQGGIGLGRYTLDDLERIHNKMLSVLAAEGIYPDAVYACPHHPQSEPCLCRKPEPLMVQKAVHRFGVNPAESLMIGDRERDIEAAAGAGVPGYLIPTNADLRQIQGPWTMWLKSTLALICITLNLLAVCLDTLAQKLIAQVYLDPSCPQTISVVDRLQVQQEQWGDQVYWIAVFSDPSLPEKECLRYLMDHNLAMALRRDPRRQYLSIYGIPQQPWLLITNPRSQTLYQGPLLEKPLPPPGKSAWESQLRRLVDHPGSNEVNSSKGAQVKGSGCPVNLP
jgi:D-glycero-D-manno-heptose 1,7-bisphosphate phosphatase